MGETIKLTFIYHLFQITQEIDILLLTEDKYYKSIIDKTRKNF